MNSWFLRPALRDPLAAIPQKEQDAWKRKAAPLPPHSWTPNQQKPSSISFEMQACQNGNLKWLVSFDALLVRASNLAVPAPTMCLPAATHETYKAWQAIGFDASEWLVPGQRVKIKFILYMDLATKLKVIHVAKEYSFVEMKAESTQDVITGFAEKWLCDKPKA